MVLDGFVRNFNAYYTHTHLPDQRTLTWCLDPARSSDLADVQGQWFVEDHPTKAGCSRVWYSAEVRLPAWLPSAVVAKIASEGGRQSVAFARDGAERAYKAAATEQ